MPSASIAKNRRISLRAGWVTKYLMTILSYMINFFRNNWKGTVVILAVTSIFFWPIITRIDSYSEGGDAMFNAWTLARNHHCILREGCSSYVNSNIFYSFKDSMLFSETQLSAGLLTLPLHFINENPIFSYNVWTVASFFFMGWFMYLLAKNISKGHETASIIAGLIFAFAPFRMPALSHLQNSSIFYLPLIVLLILKYFSSKKSRYVVFLFLALVLQFYASWYQMFFSLVVVFTLLAGHYIFKLEKIRPIGIIAATILLALVSTLPLATQYMRFSKETSSSFKVSELATYSASLADYAIPDEGTALGKIYYKIRPDAQKNSFNPDSRSYFGIGLFLLLIAILFAAFKLRKTSKEMSKNYKYVLTFSSLVIIGFIMSLGPLLKIKGHASYANSAEGLSYVIPLPYILVNLLLPQLNFVRAIGRAAVITLFAFSCLVALSPYYLQKMKSFRLGKYKKVIISSFIFLFIFELFPLHQMPMRTTAYSYNLEIPAVYKYVKEHDEIDNILILSADWDYPEAGIPVKLPEQVLWAGYHNKNIYNGYSGYLPPAYYPQYWDFLDFNKDDIAKLQKLNLRYIIVDKTLSESNPALPSTIKSVLGDKNTIYEDDRFVLLKV